MEYTMLPGRAIAALTGLSSAKIKKLTAAFSHSWNEATQKKNAKRPGRPGKFANRHILIFVLAYLKTGMTFDALAVLFGTNRSTYYRLVQQALNALQQALHRGGYLPPRDLNSVFEVLLALKGKKKIFIDATEINIRRPKYNQKKYYSGKKKRHTVKNQIICDKGRRIIALSPTAEGKQHDFKIFKNQAVRKNIPKGVTTFVDLGYVGISAFLPKNKIKIPHKKPRMIELTEKQKASNRKISSKRVVVEHAIGGIKRMYSISETCRSINFDVRDKKIHVSAGLWNLMIAP